MGPRGPPGSLGGHCSALWRALQRTPGHCSGPWGIAAAPGAGGQRPSGHCSDPLRHCSVPLDIAALFALPKGGTHRGGGSQEPPTLEHTAPFMPSGVKKCVKKFVKKSV